MVLQYGLCSLKVSERGMTAVRKTERVRCLGTVLAVPRRLLCDRMVNMEWRKKRTDGEAIFRCGWRKSLFKTGAGDQNR